MLDVKISVCNQKNTCFDCDNTDCWHQGKKSADCPKYTCDRQGVGFLNCEHCAFVDRIIKDERERYKAESEGKE